MIRERYEKAAEIFQKALDEPEGKRAGFIEIACEGDADLLAVVRGLLQSDSEESFLDGSLGLPAPAFDDDLDRPEEIVSIGDYEISKVIARGSMGIVFLAQQANPRRDVALKLLSIGEDTPGSLLAEATLLGRLQHPGLARIYEAGTAIATLRDGATAAASFIAMEHIEAETLAESISRAPMKRLDVARLLLGITEAIEHAHQRGVIHRDLKPSNILVDADGRPHVIDFGVGLLRDGHESAPGTRGIAGTIAYMAPEQLVGRMDQVDTRVDIYSIGVIAYELLTGNAPHGAADSIDEALLDRIRSSEVDTKRALTKSAGREFAGVVAKAMSRDRDDRYASAGALADDLRCVIAGRPTASDDGSAFRSLWRYALGHRVTASLLAGAFALCLAAILGLALASAEAGRSAERADRALESARTEALHAERIAEFLKAAFLGVDPEEQGSSVTLLDAIDYASGRIHRDLADVPAVEADVRSAIGFVYRRQGRFAEAFEQTRIAHRLHRQFHGPDDERTKGAAEELAYLTWIYEGDAAASLAGLEELLKDPDSETPAHVGWVSMKAGLVALAMDDLPRAEAHLIVAGPKLVEAYGEVFGARAMRHLSLVRLYSGDHSEAERLAREAVAACLGAAEQEYIVARCLVTLGQVLVERGRYDEALAVLGEAEVRMTALIGPSGPDVADLHATIAKAEYNAGRPAAAVERADRAVEILRSTVSLSHPDLASTEAFRMVYAATGDAERRDRLAAAYRTLDHAFGPDHRLSIEMLRLSLEHARAMNEDHAVRRLGSTLEILNERRLARLANGAG